MIKANELRLGNLIFLFTKQEIFEVDLIAKTTVNSENYCRMYSEFEGIPLTKEWLLKAGFVNILEPTYFEYETVDFQISFNNGIIDLCVGQYVENGTKLEHIKYVHQLQNLFFSLVGEELVFSSTEP